MYKHIFKKAAIVALVLFSIAYSCNEKPCCEGGEIGSLKDLRGTDGCGFVVEINEGERLEVVNLSDFDITIKDGKKVSIIYHEIEAMSICMSGKMVEADCICDISK